jgi:hypothetical protein
MWFHKGANDMSTELLEQRSIHISPEKFLAFVSEMMGANVGHEDDEHATPPDRYASLVREALDRIPVNAPHWTNFDPNPSHGGTRRSEFGPQPESAAWGVALTSLFEKYPALYDLIPRGVQKRGEEVSLNPQPLPPRLAFLAAVVQKVVSRAELLHEVAGAIADEGERRGIIIVGGHLSRFCDEFCGNNFRLIWPFPGPHPNWFTTELRGIDLIVMATQFHRAAKEAFSPDLSQHFADAGARFVEAGLSKLQ